MARLNLPARVAVAFVLAAGAVVFTGQSVRAQQPINFGNLTMWDGKDRSGKMQQKTDVFVWNGNLYAVTTCNWCGAAWSFWSQTDYPELRPVVALEVVGIYAVDNRPCAKMGGSQIVWNGQMYQPHSNTPWPMIGADGIMGWIGWNATGWGGLKGVVTENLNPKTRHEDPYHLQYCGEVRCWTLCWPPDPPEMLVVVNRVWIRG